MNDKQRVALHAANLIEDGMVVGLGTGSTANYFIDELASRHADGLTITTVASSIVSANRAQQMGLTVIAMEQLSNIDVYVDGADEVSPNMALLKGRGSDLVREKLLANASDQFLVLIDSSKCVDRIGQNFPIPIEVAPFSWKMVLHSVVDMGGKGALRPNGDGLAVTSHGSLVLDMAFDAALTSQQLNEQLNAVPGIVEHGIFEQLATAILIGENDQVTILKTG
ncbi:MAG: ribose 5-phosphate isomerase A [Methylophaga sp.]|nr:MAG: ribose 5-phosphate isomerase A [Methylophaga sp.]